MCGVVAMTVLDLSVVNVALPSIQEDLRADPADLQWVVVVYGVLVAGFLLLGGRLGDLIGHRRILGIGIAVLAAASVLAGLAGDLATLLAGRAGQGLGAALAAPNALAVLARTFPEGPDRNRALGIFGAAGGTAAIGGSLVGGLLVAGPGWEWVFFLNVPLGVALVVAVLTGVPADRTRPTRAHLDLGGAVGLTAGMVVLAVGVHESIDTGWLSAPTLALLATGLALLAAFVAIERRVRTPLIPPRALRKPALVLSAAAAALLWSSFLGLIYQATLFSQQVLGWSPLSAGASTIPIAVLSLVVSATVAPRLVPVLTAPTTLALGLLGMAAGFLLLARAPADAAFLVDVAPAYCVVGTGLGLAEVAVQIAAFTGTRDAESGLVGGVIETAREMGGALGLALLVAFAVGSTTDLTQAFHRSVVGAAVLALLGAVVAFVGLRRYERTDLGSSA